MIELGGNIKLAGFKELDPPTLIVVKKIVGNYARKIHEHAPAFNELMINISNDYKKEKRFEVTAKLATSDKNSDKQASSTNLFFAMDSALAALLAEYRK